MIMSTTSDPGPFRFFRKRDGLLVPFRREKISSAILKAAVAAAREGAPALAESKAHGVPVTDVHFHEVGTMDAIADVTAVCLLMDRIKPQKTAASPVNVGGGTVRCAHGIIPVPAPATANILEGIPSYSGDIKSELCTPTGAALLKYFVEEFTDMPEMSIEKCGHGMGTKYFERANCVRITLGEVD